jgi:Glycosyl hydrolase family 59
MRGWYGGAWRVVAVGLTCVLAVTGAIAAGALTTKSPAKTPERRSGITINGARVGPAFQGVGAISGGGGNSRLIVDYPPKQQRQILDYLFKPGYGASLQILKLEIGGDAYATDGAEPSFEHIAGQKNCQAGYELWLAHQARLRNPAIQLVALQWNAPRWVGGRAGNPWSLTDIGYVIDWLKCARSTYGLHFNYLGGWNEHLPHGITAQVMGWFIRLRAALNRNGFGGVRIIAVDSFAHLHNGKDISNFLFGHPDFRRVINVLGYHNLCKYPATGNHCKVTHAARASGKPIWESEIGALRQGTGIGAMTRSINNAYIEVRATGLVAWPLMGSMPAYLPEEDRGLLFADEPWSGQFHVQPMTWVIAQTTQFTQSGWRHVLGAAGHLNGSSSGSYTTYESPNHSAWTMVVQTSDAPATQTITVNVDRGLPRSVVHVWSTNIKSHNSRSWFVHRGDIRAAGGTFRYLLRPGYIYTFTTVKRPGKGTAVSPRSRKMPLPYTDKPDTANEPRYLGAEDGAFEYTAPGIFSQTAAGPPVFWQNPVTTRFPYAVIGDNGWHNYTVSVKVRFSSAGQIAGLITRFDHPKANGVAQQFDGYQFNLSSTGSWKLLKDEPRKPPRLMRTGKLAKAPGVHNWVQMTFAVHGKLLVCKVGAKQVVALRDPDYSFGDAGVSTGGWYPVQFQHLTITK